MKNAKITNKPQKASRLALWVTIGAAVWLWFSYSIILGELYLYEVVTTFPIWLAGIAATIGFILSIVKIAISRTWRGRLLGVVLILINLTVMAMSTFSIVLSHVNFMG